MNLPIGLYSCLLSLLLIAVFTFRLYSGKASLPLALSHRPAPPTQSPDSWRQSQWLIFILVGPFFLLRGLADAFLALPTLLWRDSIPSFYLSVELALASVADAPLAFDNPGRHHPYRLQYSYSVSCHRKGSMELPNPHCSLGSCSIPLVPILASGTNATRGDWFVSARPRIRHLIQLVSLYNGCGG